MQVAILLFEDFETLDVFGPVEIFGRLKDHYQVAFYSLKGGLVSNQHGVRIDTMLLEKICGGVDIFLVPGGYGTRVEVNNPLLLTLIKQISAQSSWVLTVCTGSALLAATGLLDNRTATSNKKAFDWVAGTGENVNWVKKARWTVDGKFYTSAGVSAGMDMTLGFLEHLHGLAFARKVAFEIEYDWQENKDHDPFSDGYPGTFVKANKNNPI